MQTVYDINTGVAILLCLTIVYFIYGRLYSRRDASLLPLANTDLRIDVTREVRITRYASSRCIKIAAHK
jgi:hypothetical protein